MCIAFCCMYVCACIMLKCGIHRGQNRMLNPLELELQNVVICHVDAEIKAGSSGKASSTLNCGAVSPSPVSFFLFNLKVIEQKWCCTQMSHSVCFWTTPRQLSRVCLIQRYYSFYTEQSYISKRTYGIHNICTAHASWSWKPDWKHQKIKSTDASNITVGSGGSCVQIPTAQKFNTFIV